MASQKMDPSILDFTWKQNRLSKDKESLKAQMLGIIKRNPDKKREDKDKAQAGQTNNSGAKGVSGTD